MAHGVEALQAQREQGRRAARVEAIGDRDVLPVQREGRVAGIAVAWNRGRSRGVSAGHVAGVAAQLLCQLRGVGQPRLIERKRDLGRTMVLVGDERPQQRPRGKRQRPAHDRRGESRLSEDAPERQRAQRVGVLHRFGQQPRRHETVRETEVRKQIDFGVRAIRRRERGGGAHAVARGELPGCHGRQHGPGLRRPKRGQVQGRAGIEQAAEVRQPPIGRRRRDEVEAGAVDREQDHARLVPLGRGCADFEPSRTERLGTSEAAREHGQPDGRDDQHDHGKPSGTAPALADREPQDGEHDEGHRADRHRGGANHHRLRGLVVERRAKAAKVQPHQCRGGHRGAGAEDRQHAYAEPPGREGVGGEHQADAR